MATAASIQRSRAILHTRGTWSAREDRIPSAVWLGILWVGFAGGFGLDISRFRHQQPPAPSIIYVHAFVFTAWLLILTAQVLLVLGDRVAWHKKLGWFAAGWAVLMAIFGPAAALDVAAMHLPHPHPFLSVQLTGVPTFLALLAWGFALRRNPAAHRRMMILATVAIAGPGFDRLSSHLLHLHADTALSFFFVVDYGSLLLIVLIAAWDLWRGRLMRSFVIGAAALLAVQYLAGVVYFWAPWSAFTVSLLRAWVKL